MPLCPRAVQGPAPDRRAPMAPRTPTSELLPRCGWLLVTDERPGAEAMPELMLDAGHAQQPVDLPGAVDDLEICLRLASRQASGDDDSQSGAIHERELAKVEDEPLALVGTQLAQLVIELGCRGEIKLSAQDEPPAVGQATTIDHELVVIDELIGRTGPPDTVVSHRWL